MKKWILRTGIWALKNQRGIEKVVEIFFEYGDEWYILLKPLFCHLLNL